MELYLTGLAVGVGLGMMLVSLGLLVYLEYFKR